MFANQCLGYEQLTDLDAAASLTVPSGARLAIIQAEVKAVRWRDDGTAPTAAVGMVLASGASMEYGGDLSAFSAIEVETGGILNVTYYA
jgi:hypothetical protein